MSASHALPRSDRVTLTGMACIGILAVLAWFRSQLPADDGPAAAPAIASHERIVDFAEGVVIFETVFWEPDDTLSLRELIRAGRIADGRTVLEIGTGSGLLALCCARNGAASVVATDINPNAVANARFNAQRLGLTDVIDVRRVDLTNPGAFAVVRPGETFDLIISNPPWEDRPPGKIDSYALNDEGFELMRSLLSGLRERLNPGGKALLAYGCVTAIREVQRLAPRYGLRVSVFDDRRLDQLDEVFLPGMLLVVTPE